MQIIKGTNGESRLSIAREEMGQLISILDTARIETQANIDLFEGEETILLKIYVERLAFIQEAMDMMFSI